jgi:hypothetical protein
VRTKPVSHHYKAHSSCHARAVHVGRNLLSCGMTQGTEDTALLLLHTHTHTHTYQHCL